ncbi:SHOCT domain-containing protein [uncultured Mameliella sp.]|uniref:SHOCT domain-containing protein n=1 Tax=uncultured Mameliella sp. TaxID=1447087 RepID=UPI002611DE6E|nr:SHOCT domain-containing protein [uncultured Mameliella sp.]
MSPLTDHGLAVQSRLSQAYGLSPDAVLSMMDAVSRGGGMQAQFNVPELGGMGQWQSGGMTMVGDMFNTGLKNTVNNLCGEISNAYYQGSFYQPAPQPQGSWQGQQQGGASMTFSGGSFGSWWPSDLGQPSSQGSQNNLSYAIFPQSRRLAVNLNGQVTVYDTGDHLIGGVGQQQSGDASWTFTSQYGTVYLNQLPVVSGAGSAPEPSVVQPEPTPMQPEPVYQPEPVSQPDPAPAPVQQGGNSDQIFAALEKLGSLRDMGILSEDEFAAKKAELLSRL